ncbi:MAG: DNA repair protein RecN [Cyanobacteria bacterium]|nr:DNA repair protein RecN [Cyanobacteriota bacterium]MDW8201844.1 DNA repair protein RecN [Cyanobacteriota bacterium SKYGB_h_bin112]
MLRFLRIENIALIDRLDLEFSEGLTVLTGETGAGKSIILDAIAAALGGDVTPRMMRSGAKTAKIEATFDLTPPLQAWLASQTIQPLPDGTLVCSRELTYTDGKLASCSRLNGVVLNLSQVAQLRDYLVDITAQGQTMLLGHSSVQQEWLDNFGGADLLAQRQRVADAFNKFQQAYQAWERRRLLEQERQERLTAYKRQLKELKTVGLSDPQELQALEREQQRLNHAVELQRQSYQVYQLLYQTETDSPASADLMGEAVAVLEEMIVYDPSLEAISDMVQQALALVQDAGRRISSYGDSVEADPQRLEVVTQRIAALKQICRKYGPTLQDAIAHQKRIQAELVDLMGGGQSLEELEQATHTAQATLMAACAQLTTLRQQAAQTLEAQLLDELRPLAMDRVQFQVRLTATEPTATGADDVSFWFSPNPGEGLQPLAEIASGGEMSRFLLALKACFSHVSPVDTLVFDEIDVGVSGRVSWAIADKLYQLGTRHQVLCVTHQPIVAAMAAHHLRVDKRVIDAPDRSGGKVRTVVQVTPLTDEQRREELVSLAGAQSTADRRAAYAYADSLLAKAARRQAGDSDDTDSEDAPNPINDRVDRLIAALSET